MNRKKDQKMILLIVLILVAVMVAGAVLLGSAILILWFANRAPRLDDSQEVIAYLQEQGDALGYENALSELTEANTQTVDGNRYYRLQQNYQGIPVFGRTVVCVADANGNPVALTQNVMDIPADLDLTPSVDPGTVMLEVARFFDPYDPDAVLQTLEPVALERSDLCIFNLNGTATLAYETYAFGYELVVDAHTGQVLHCRNSLVEATAIFQESGRTVDVPLLEDGRYILKDQRTGTYLYTANGNPYWTVEEDIFGRLVDKYDYENLRLVSGFDLTFGDGNDSVGPDSIRMAENILDLTNDLRSFYVEMAGEAPFERLVIIYDDAITAYAGRNAAGGWSKPSRFLDDDLPDLTGSDKKEKAGLIIIGSAYSGDIMPYADVLAHEYTHVISHKTVQWSGDNLENGALDEAFSDIFGELYELRVHGTADWIAAGRTIYQPSLVQLAEQADPDDVRLHYWWWENGTTPRDTTYRYFYSTVISHIAYKMYTGSDTIPDSAIPPEQLGELWYGTMLMLPSDADFADCRTAVTTVAEIMGLSEAQRQNITDAFDAASIPEQQDANVLYVLDKTCTLSVFDRDGQPCTHYSVRVDEPVEFGHLPSTRQVLYAELEEDEVCVLKLDKGKYWITLRDLSGSGGEVFFAVEVKKNGLTELPVHTNFGPIPEEEAEELPPLAEEEVYDPPAKLPMSNEETAHFDTILWDRSYTDAEGTTWVNYSYEYIQLRGSSEAVKRINEALYQDAYAYMTQYSQEALETPNYYYNTDIRIYCTYTSETRIQHNADGILAVSIHVEEYAGGSQTLMWNNGFVFDLTTGERLTLEQLVGMEGEELNKALRSITWDYINSSQMVWDTAERSLQHYTVEDFDFSIKDGQIYLYINNAYSLVFTQSGSISFPSGWYISDLRGN